MKKKIVFTFLQSRSFLILLWALAAYMTFINVPICSAAHGISIDGKLKYKPGFKQFDYTSEQARKGGSLILHDLGSFDKMNPYTLKGSAPSGLNNLVFETLTASSLDEPFAAYGLIAKDIELADDRLSVTYTIDENAKFSDGTAITPEDVEFSLNTLKSNAAHPFYQAYLQDITSSEILGKDRIRFNFARVNRELHMIASQVPVFSKKFYSKHPFDDPSMVPPVGSGPYVVETVNPGKSITYKRNPDYWAKDHPTRKGMFNFDTITFKYFRDQIVSVEAFKANEFDFMYINIAKQWARDLVGPKFDSKRIIKEYLPHKNNQGMQGFVFNLRNPLFQDRGVRMALGMAFDFEWANNNLFFNEYTRSASYFSNSDLAAKGRPEGLELEYLLPFKEQLPPEIFNQQPTPFSTEVPNSLRGNLRKAKKILEEAGWTVQDGRLADKEGRPFEFEILLVSPSFERVMAGYVNNLNKLGVNASYRTIDPALYIDRLNRFDFDMTVNVFGQSQSPGNEQRDYWHSGSAERQGSRNLIGIKDPIVDELVDKIIYATTQEELTAACRALDRVLWYGFYVVPNWYVARHRVSYWNKFNRPEKLPLYYNPIQALMTWWMK
ncbi:MAG: ABC transporter substrate-binding protein [Deltaproteobacteria bacterium]|nr:ABC transporter substrate-binding protein [Deltaproteobacteria bacterium]MBW2484325.1 ABC transporter substrate-binding protein [Deltaproteobacteria bacterium]